MNLQEMMGISIPRSNHWDRRFFEVHANLPKLTPIQINEAKRRLARYATILNLREKGGRSASPLSLRDPPSSSPNHNAGKDWKLPKDQRKWLSYDAQSETLSLIVPYHENDAESKKIVRVFKKVVQGSKLRGGEWIFPIRNHMMAVGVLEAFRPDFALHLRNHDYVIKWQKRERRRRNITNLSADFDPLLKEVYRLIDVHSTTKLKLMDHQKMAVAFIEAGGGRVILADEQGLGKTAPAIFYSKMHNRKTLIVCPSSIKLAVWANELLKWTSQDSIQVYSGKASKTGKEYWDEKGIDIIDQLPKTKKACPKWLIVNFEMLYKLREELAALGYKNIIIDEADRLKNMESRMVIGMFKAASFAESIICLTGTPLKNRPVELFVLLHLLRSSEYPSYWDFVNRYCDPKHDPRGDIYALDVRGSANEHELYDRLQSLMLRRKKTDVLDLPAKKIRIKHVQLFDMKRYNDMKERLLGQLKRREIGELELINELRIETGRQKALEVVNYCMKLKQPAIIFHHHKEVGNLIEEYLPGTVARIDGRTSDLMRARIIADFQMGHYDFLVGSTLSCSAGITLTRAKLCIFAEREWVPADEKQAEDRIHRIGQDQEVKIVYFSAIDTIDNIFEKVIKQKKNVIDSIIEGKVVKREIVKSCIAELKASAT